MVQEAAQPLDLVGTRIAHFRVVTLLGRGGMGVVYLAEDEALRRSVALKVLPPGFADDEDRRRRLLREARSAAAVSHPSIATVHEVGEADGRIYIAMELVRGRSLADVLAERRLPVPEVLRIAGQILDAVGKAHEAGLVHRDQRRQEELRDRSILAWEKGDFTQAEALLREGIRAAGADPNAEQHDNALNLVLILRETGRAKDAAGVAKEYLERVDGWRDSISAGGTLTMLAAMFHGGALSREELHAKRAAWLARAKPVYGDEPVRLWMMMYGGEIETTEEAKESLAALSGLPKYATDPANLASLPLGEAYLLAGRADEALPFLRREQRSCFAFGSPRYNRDLYYLGLALEQTGDKPGACDAYAAVLARWGNAKPGSVTGTKAHAHAAALGCTR